MMTRFVLLVFLGTPDLLVRFGYLPFRSSLGHVGFLTVYGSLRPRGCLGIPGKIFLLQILLPVIGFTGHKV